MAVPRAQSRGQGKGTGESARSLSFRGWMAELQMCLEDIETNLESYPLDRPLSVWDLETGRPIRMNYQEVPQGVEEAAEVP